MDEFAAVLDAVSDAASTWSTEPAVARREKRRPGSEMLERREYPR